MDTPKLPDELMAAGADYYEQLKTLGLHPEGLLWMYEFERREFVLWMIWSGVDRVGPLAVSEMLFKAYRASALTQKIDPFIVSVKSPRQTISHAVLGAMDKVPKRRGVGNISAYQIRRGSSVPPRKDDDPTHHWEVSWIYHFQEKKRKALDVSKDWRRFTANVDRIAA